jgi:hypothetical protein
MSSHIEESAFPRAGVLARRWRRFEHGYRAWLNTAEGRFAVWQAQHDPAARDVARSDALAPEPGR